MMLYALGLSHEYGFLYDITTVSMTIVSKATETFRPAPFLWTS